MRTKSAILTAVLALGLTGAVFGGVSTAAAESPGIEVRQAAIGLYEHDNMDGGRATFTNSDSYLGNNSWRGQPGRIVNNNASSMRNNTDYDIRLYDVGSRNLENCRGDAYIARANSEDEDLTNNDFDNEASCLEFLR